MSKRKRVTRKDISSLDEWFDHMECLDRQRQRWLSMLCPPTPFEFGILGAMIANHARNIPRITIALNSEPEGE